MKAKLKLRLQYVAMEVKRKQKKRLYGGSRICYKSKRQAKF